MNITFIRKSCSKTVGEIDTLTQFHQPYKRSIFDKILLPKNFKPPNCKDVKGVEKTFVQKSCTKTVGEIDPLCFSFSSLALKKL